MKQNFEYHFLVGEIQGKLAKRTLELIDQVRKGKVQTLVFIDRSARPASWLFESFWISKYSRETIPQMVFINTGKKVLINSEETQEKITSDLGDDGQKALKNKQILIVDDMEARGEQKAFVSNIIAAIYHPKSIHYFNWGSKLPPHGLLYEGNTSFIAKFDPEKILMVEQIRKEITNLAKEY